MTHNTQIPFVQFNDGTEYPQLGLGTWKLRDDVAISTVREAINLGYRHIDTASLYKNEEAVGQAIRDAIAAGDVTRDELYVTSKLWHTSQGAENAAEGFQTSLEKLGLDYIDLYFIHWPWPSAGLFVETWEVLAKMQGMGSVQSLGVSNFYPEVLDELIEKTGITPVVNQVELHPGFSQPEVREYNASKHIVTAAWSPLGEGSVLDNPVIQEIATEIGKTPAQTILRWHIQLGNMVVPKSKTPKRLAENMQIFDFELSEDQMERVSNLDRTTDIGRLGGDPLTFPEPKA